MGLAPVGALVDPHQPAVGGDAAVLADRLRHDLRRRLRRGVDHLGPGVLVLAGAGVGDREHLARGLRADEVDARVLHRQLRADVAVDPLHVALGLDPGPLGDQVVDVRAPVLDRRVRDPGAGLDDDLDDGRVQRVAGVHRRRAALDVVHLGALVGDDQRALELAGVLRVDPEVGLQRHLAVDAGRDVDERAAGPHRRVERGELVVPGRDDGAEVLLDQVGVLAQGRVHVAEQDPLLGQVVAVAVVDDLGLVLGGDAGEVLALGLGDAQLLVRRLHLLGQVVPVVDLLARRLEVVVDLLEVDVGHVHGEPLGHRLAVEQAQAAQPQLGHPARLALPPRDLLDHARVDPLGRGEGVLDLVAPAQLVLGEVEIERRHGLRSSEGISTTAIVTIHTGAPPLVDLRRCLVLEDSPP